MTKKYTAPITSSLTTSQFEQLVRETDAFIDLIMASPVVAACNEGFKKHGSISPAYLMRKLKINMDVAQNICDLVHRLKTHPCPFWRGLEIGSNDQEWAECRCSIKQKLLEIDQFKNCQT